MTFRKIIKFGESSHIISLPKSWIKKNSLNKGDVVRVEEGEDHIKIFPNTEPKPEQPKETTIDFQDIKILKLQLISAYLNNYSKIKIIGKIMPSQLQEVREIVHNFVALEIIQQSPDLIVLKDYLNMRDISLQDTIRRMDRTLMSMMEDTENEFRVLGKNIDSIKAKEKDINRLSLLIFKIIKKNRFQAPKDKVDITINEIPHYWELSVFMEKIADQVKRIPLFITEQNKSKILPLYKQVCEYYKEIMKAHYTKNLSEARNLIIKKTALLKETESHIKEAERCTILIEKIKNMIYQSCAIADSMIKTKAM